MNLFLKFLFILTLPIVSAFGGQSHAQDYPRFFQDFRSQDLSYDERRYLQAALAFEGHYFGLLDGDWGRLSRDAMARYSFKEFGTQTEEWHVALLALTFFNTFNEQGWNMEYFSSLDMSILLPTKQIIIDPPTEHLFNLRHEKSSLSVSLGTLNKKTASNFHSYTQKLHAFSTKPYSVRKTNFAVSTGTKRDGQKVYTRSNFINGRWSTIMVSAEKWDANVLSAVTSSISVGKTREIYLPVDGNLFSAISRTLALIEEEEKKEEQSRIAVPKDETPPKNASGFRNGSGFVVSDEGHVLTNAHVVEGCTSIFVDGVRGNLVSASDTFDLAVVKSQAVSGKSVAVFSALPARLNSDVTAVGYPYAGLLGGLNVTRGSVSSLSGLNGDLTKMQITAPVQNGNSGGPLLASDGEVVGVVVSKLNAQKITKELGDTPQNVNFAIRGEIAKLFLAQNQIEPKLSMENIRLPPEEIAERASAFTAFIECN